MNPATRDAKFRAVFSQRRAIRLKRFSLPTACSMRAAALVDCFCEACGLSLFIGLVRDHGNCATATCSLPVGLAGISLVAHHRAWLDIGTERKQDGKVRRVGFLATGQVESNRMAVKVCFQMDFRREPAARAAERLVCCPLLRPLPKRGRGLWCCRTFAPAAQSN